MWQGTARTSEVSPDLYCHESLANFDDDDFSFRNVIQTSNMSVENDLHQSTTVLSTCGTFNNKTANNNCLTVNSNNVNSTCKRKINYESFENCISILDDDDYVKLLQTDEILDKPVECFQTSKHITEDKFSKNLLNEFARSSKSAIENRENHASVGSFDITSWMKSRETVHSNANSNWSQTPSRYGDYEQQVPEMTVTMNDQNCLDDGNFDALIIKDEGMCDSDSGSELDWDSLTPPVPASPSDQKVPETEFDLDFCGHIGYGNPLAPSSSTESFLSSSVSSVEQPSHHWYFQPQVAFVNIEDISHTESDQVVPVL